MSDEKKEKIKTFYDILNDYYYECLQDELIDITQERNANETEHRSDSSLL